MKKSFIILSFGFLGLHVGLTQAQNKTFSIGASAPNSNAALHVESPTNNQGMILPRLTTAQRTAMVLSATDAGLSLYDSDLKLILTWDGAAWKNAGFSLPFVGSAGGSVNSFDVTNTGTGNAGYFKVANTASLGNAVFATTNSSNDRPAIYGEHTGTGSAGGSFKITNAANSFAGVYGETVGTGSAGYFKIINTANSFSGVTGETNGTGAAVFGSQLGLGRAGQFQISNAANSDIALRGATTGTGIGSRVTINNTANASQAIYAETNGTGEAGLFSSTNAGSSAPGLRINYSGTGNALQTTGNVQAGKFVGDGSLLTNLPLTTGLSFPFSNAVTTSLSPATSVFTLSYDNAVTARLMRLENLNAGNAGSTLSVLQQGTGIGVFSQVANATAGNHAIYGTINSNLGGGDTAPCGILGETTGTASVAGSFRSRNSGNTYPSLFTESLGSGPSISANSAGTGSAGYFSKNGTGTNATLSAESLIATAGVGYFRINSATNNQAVIYSETNGVGTVLQINHVGSSGNIAVFQSASSNVARIDKTGKGFFNGGTQSSGADVAEMFDVEGARNEYEPGDVLVISESADRTVEKSSQAYSVKVVGVYATKPGITLTEMGMDESLDKLVPMGVIGVIPTKVCLENGPIKRGDLLTTSSRKGYAMKAVSLRGDGVFPSGAILGKALENFDGAEAGLIKVLVNVK